MSLLTSSGLLVMSGGAAVSSGLWVDGASFTVIPPGGGLTSFGTNNSVPNLWDRGQDGPGVISSQYKGAWPNAANDSNGNLFNRTLPFQYSGSSTISAGPTPLTNTILAGNHWNVNSANGGDAVMAWVQHAVITFPYWEVSCWYHMADNNWWVAGDPGSITFSGSITAGSAVISSISPALPTQGLTTGEGCVLFQNTSPGAVNIPSEPTINSTDSVANTITMSAAATGTGTRTVSITAQYSSRDGNYKTADYSWPNNSPYDTSSWYHAQSMTNTTSAGFQMQLENNTAITPYTVINDPDNNSHNAFWLDGANDSKQVWTQSLRITRMDTATTGYDYYYENNGSKLVNYQGQTAWPLSAIGNPTTTGMSFGGYSRAQGYYGNGQVANQASNGTLGTYTQWRYFGNLFNNANGAGSGMFILSNSGAWTLGSGVAFEPQPWSAWGGSSVTVQWNKGNLNSGAAYLYFWDLGNSISPTLVASGTLA